MTLNSKIVFLIVFSLAAVVSTTAPLAFGDHATAEISIPQGTSVQGCEKTNECYLPPLAQIDIGGEATWSNDDSAAHTVTSGLAAEGADGIFDSGLFMAGQTFSVKFDDYEPGEYAYFCLVHPWMTGAIVVLEDESEEEEHEGEMINVMGMSSDGSIMVEIESSEPHEDEHMVIEVIFKDVDGNHIEHINYDITATQDGNTILSEVGVHEPKGEGHHTTDDLSSDSQVEIAVTIRGIGLDTPFSGPQGDVVDFTVVPEFGTIAMMVLGVSIVSIIALTAKSKVIPRL